MGISSNAYSNENYKLDLLDLAYHKTPEEVAKETAKVVAAEMWLEARGIDLKTEYGYYRNTWDILKDFGEYLVKNDKITVNLMEVIDESKLA